MDLSESLFDDVNLSRCSFQNITLAECSIRDACLENVTIEDGARYDGIARINGILVTDLMRVYLEKLQQLDGLSVILGAEPDGNWLARRFGLPGSFTGIQFCLVFAGSSALVGR